MTDNVPPNPVSATNPEQVTQVTTTTKAEQATLACSLLKAQKLVRAVAKSGRNPFHKYAYARAEDVIAEAREALNESDLALIQQGWTLDTSFASDDTYGRVKVSLALLHTSGVVAPFDISVPALKEKGRGQDKSEAAAVTYALNYFLRGLLLIPREDENTNAVDTRDDNQIGNKRQQTAELVRPPPAPTTNGQRNPVFHLIETMSTDDEVKKAKFLISSMVDGDEKDEAKNKFNARLTNLKQTESSSKKQAATMPSSV